MHEGANKQAKIKKKKKKKKKTEIMLQCIIIVFGLFS